MSGLCSCLSIFPPRAMFSGETWAPVLIMLSADVKAMPFSSESCEDGHKCVYETHSRLTPPASVSAPAPAPETVEPRIHRHAGGRGHQVRRRGSRRGQGVRRGRQGLCSQDASSRSLISPRTQRSSTGHPGGAGKDPPRAASASPAASQPPAPTAPTPGESPHSGEASSAFPGAPETWFMAAAGSARQEALNYQALGDTRA